jgi:hypothetical protein
VRLDLTLEQVAQSLAKQLVFVGLDHRPTVSPAIFGPARRDPYTAHS